MNEQATNRYDSPPQGVWRLSEVLAELFGQPCFAGLMADQGSDFARWDRDELNREGLESADRTTDSGVSPVAVVC
jgi:hypothetical protein